MAATSTFPLRASVHALACTMLLSSACMLTPENGQVLDSSATAVTFSGYVPNAGGLVQLSASSNASGPFSPWSGSSVSASSTPALFSVPATNGTIPVFQWSLASTIPPSYWAVEQTPAGCDVDVTYVRARTGSYNLYSFDVASPTYPGGAACLLGEILGGGTILDALNACASPSSPVVRLEAPALEVHPGNVTITSQAQANAFACVGTIDGDLTIAPSSPTTITLPSLVTVSGSVSLSLPVQAPPTGSVVQARCGSPAASTYASIITRVQLPALVEIAGDLDIDVPSTGVATTAGEPIELDLDALTDLGGDLSLSFATPAITPCGLASLPAVAGDLDIGFDQGDVGASNLLASLSSADGQVTVTGGYTVGGLLPELEQAGALLLQDIVNLNPSTSLSGLTTVDGDVVIRDLPNPVVQGLTSAGALVVDDTSIPSLSFVGSNAVTTSALTLTRNGNLSDLGSAAASDVSFSSNASLTIGTGAQANASLTSAEICEFVAQQVANGWTPNGTGFSCP